MTLKKCRLKKISFFLEKSKKIKNAMLKKIIRFIIMKSTLYSNILKQKIAKIGVKMIPKNKKIMAKK
jgi:hypothetical protein